MEKTINRRRASEATRRVRLAAMLVRPINNRLGPLQEETARLVAMAERGEAVGEPARRLCGQVEQELACLEAQVGGLDAATAADSRIADTRRALCQIATRLRGAMARAEPRDDAQV